MTPDDAEHLATAAQVYGDLLTLVIANAGPLPSSAAQQRVEAALAERAAIEQAKGVLAVHRDVGMEEAYRLLVDLAAGTGQPIGQAARAVVRDAQRPPAAQE